MGLRDARCSQFQSYTQGGGESPSTVWPHSLLKPGMKRSLHSKWLERKTGSAPNDTVRHTATPPWWAITLSHRTRFFFLERGMTWICYRSANSSHWLSRRQNTSDSPSDNWKIKRFLLWWKEYYKRSCVNVFCQEKLCIALDVQYLLDCAHTCPNTSRVTASTLFPSSSPSSINIDTDQIQPIQGRRPFILNSLQLHFQFKFTVWHNFWQPFPKIRSFFFPLTKATAVFGDAWPVSFHSLGSGSQNGWVWCFLYTPWIQRGFSL